MQLSQPVVSMNLFKDLEDVLRKKLSVLGIAPKKAKTVEDLCLAYFNAIHRKVSPLKRNVLYSKELQVKLPTLPAQIQTAIATIQKQAEEGKDLNCFLTTKTLIDEKDPLFNDWKIIHFHLGNAMKTVKTQPFVQRTKELLFVYATKDTLYMIDVLDHDPVNGFANQELLQIVHDNWPHLTKPFILQGIKAAPITNAQISTARKAGVSFSVPMRDGTMLYSPGGGYVSSGDNFDLVRLVDKLFAEIRALESKIRTNPQGYISSTQKEMKRQETILGASTTILDVKLVDCPNGFKVIETISGCQLHGWEYEKNH
jgi:hypothetical protein